MIPAGVTVICSLASLNRDPETFPNPKSFDPENFSPSNKRAKEKDAFLPFSGGARNCIGEDDIFYKLAYFTIPILNSISNLKYVQ